MHNLLINTSYYNSMNKLITKGKWQQDYDKVVPSAVLDEVSSQVTKIEIMNKVYANSQQASSQATNPIADHQDLAS